MGFLSHACHVRMNTTTKTPPLSKQMLALVGGKRKRLRGGVKMNKLMIVAKACSSDDTTQSEILLKTFMEDYLESLSLEQERRVLSCLKEQCEKVDRLLADLTMEKLVSEAEERKKLETKEPMKLKQFF